MWGQNSIFIAGLAVFHWYVQSLSSRSKGKGSKGWLFVGGIWSWNVLAMVSTHISMKFSWSGMKLEVERK